MRDHYDFSKMKGRKNPDVKRVVMNEMQDLLWPGDLLGDCLYRSEHLCENTKRHLKEGLVRRLLIIQISRLKIIEIVSADRTGVIPGPEAVELNLHLNAYYFQLRGALDNAAWALHYQFGLMGAVNEDDLTARRKCDLFSKDFLDRISKDHPVLATGLRSKTEWATDLKQLRDPAAHRIPLYAVPGIRSPEEDADASTEWQKGMAVVGAMMKPIGEYNGMDDAERMIHQGNHSNDQFETAISHFVKSDQIGHHAPIFAVSGPNGHQIREIRPQMDTDHEAFVSVIKIVVNELVSVSV